MSFEPAASLDGLAAHRHIRRMRWLGAALGLASGPAAGFGQAWAGTGDGRWHVWLIASAVAAALGAVTLPIFYPAHEREPLALDGPGPGFSALFGLAVGIVAGAFSAFPMGAVMGGFGGALGGAIAGLLWRRVGVVAAAICGPAVGLVGVWLWTGGLG